MLTIPIRRLLVMALGTNVVVTHPGPAHSSASPWPWNLEGGTFSAFPPMFPHGSQTPHCIVMVSRLLQWQKTSNFYYSRNLLFLGTEGFYSTVPSSSGSLHKDPLEYCCLYPRGTKLLLHMKAGSREAGSVSCLFLHHQSITIAFLCH